MPGIRITQGSRNNSGSRRAQNPDTAGNPEARGIQPTKRIEIKKLGRTQILHCRECRYGGYRYGRSTS